MPQNRTKTGRFKPGSSGTPGGRPKRTPEQRDALEAVKSLAPDAVRTMERLLKAKNTSPTLKVRIAEIVLDRACLFESLKAYAPGCLKQIIPCRM